MFQQAVPHLGHGFIDVEQAALEFDGITEIQHPVRLDLVVHVIVFADFYFRVLGSITIFVHPFAHPVIEILKLAFG
ncbi:hypothetical protein D1872_335640 [compost metagenome]